MDKILTETKVDAQNIAAVVGYTEFYATVVRCSAGIISEYWVITSSTCAGGLVEAATTSVIEDFDGGSRVHKADTIVRHPSQAQGPPEVALDAMLVRSRTALTFSSAGGYRLAAAADYLLLEPGTRLLLLGYRLARTTYKPELRSDFAMVMPHDRCPGPHRTHNTEPFYNATWGNASLRPDKLCLKVLSSFGITKRQTGGVVARAKKIYALAPQHFGCRTVLNAAPFILYDDWIKATIEMKEFFK